MDKDLKNILSDKTSGSEEILEKLNDYVKENYSSGIKIKKLISIGRHQLSSFQAIQNYLTDLKLIISKNDSKKVRDFSEDIIREKKTLYRNIYKNLKPKIKDFNSVFTLSNSRTILEVISLWKNDEKNIKVFLSESRPANEGQILAEKLLKKNIEVIFSIDADMSRQIAKADFVLISADRIINNKSVINKTGSTAAAIIARFYRKPFYVISSKYKIINRGVPSFEENDSKEIWDNESKNLIIINKYFEDIDIDLITEVITD